MSRVALSPPPDNGLMALADHLVAEQLVLERGHKRGLAAAAAAVEATIHEIDGRWPQRSEAYEIGRRAVSAYINQIQRMTSGGER